MQQVVLNDLRLAVGHVLQLVPPVDIAERPHPRRTGSPKLVHDDLTAYADVDTTGLGADVVSVRAPAGGNEQRVALDDNLTIAGRRTQADALRGHVHPLDVSAQHQLETVGGQFGVTLRDLVILHARAAGGRG